MNPEQQNVAPIQSEEVSRLTAELARKEKTIRVLMDRVEQDMNVQGSDYSFFQTTVMLGEQVRERTQRLEEAMRNLRQVNVQLAREQAEADAARSRLALAIGSSSDGFALFDADDRLVLANRQFQELWSLPGRPMSFPENPGFEQILAALQAAGHDPAWAGVWRDLHESARCGHAEVAEICVADNTWIRITEHPAAEHGIVGTYADISDMKRRESRRHEADLELERMHLREAIQNISEGIAMFDRHLNLLIWNQRFLELLELPASFGAVGTPYESLVRYDAERGEFGAGDIAEQVRRRMLEARRFQTHQFERELRDGRTMEVLGKPLPRGGFIWTFTDTTEHKRNEQALREARDELERRVVERTLDLKESEQRFHDFADSSSDWMWETDAELRFTYFSERVSNILGQDPANFLGKTREELMVAASGEIPLEWRRHLDDLKARKAFRAFEYTLRAGDGSLRRIRVSGKPVYSMDGTFLGYRGTGSDVTELVQAQHQLMAAEKLAALGGMVAGIAHEINTPVGIGVTAASHLRDQTLEFEKKYASGQIKRSEMENYLRAAIDSSSSLVTNLQRAAGLVQSFKRVAVDQSSEQRRRFNLRNYLDDVIGSLRPQFKHSAHKINVSCPADIELDSYPGALSQVLTNLILNSLLHGFDGVAAGRIDIDACREGDKLLLRYADNGIGMDAAQAGHVFEPFFTTRRGQGGSGLGLHIVYNLVTQALRGRVECRTAPAAGMQFLITVPLALDGRDASKENRASGTFQTLE